MDIDIEDVGRKEYAQRITGEINLRAKENRATLLTTPPHRPLSFTGSSLDDLPPLSPQLRHVYVILNSYMSATSSILGL